MPAYALFFRGINIGGRRIKMDELTKVLKSTGAVHVQTLLQSGNAVLSHPLSPVELETLVERAIADAFGFHAEAHVRNLSDLNALCLNNPFPDFAEARPNHLVVYLAKATFAQGEVQAFAETYKGPERLAAVGRELFVTFPDGIGASMIEKTKGWKKLVGTSTARNWSTLAKVRSSLESIS